MKLIITEFIRYSSFKYINKVPIKQTLPLMRGKRYKNESSIATLVVMIYISIKDNPENHDKNWEIINKIEPIKPNNLKSNTNLICIRHSSKWFLLHKHSNSIKVNININLFFQIHFKVEKLCHPTQKNKSIWIPSTSFII